MFSVIVSVMRSNKINRIYSLVEPNKIIAIISKNLPGNRVNLTPENQILQASIINFGRNTKVVAHSHLNTERNTFGTQEAWVVLKGKAEVLFYDLDKKLINSKLISKGQVIILFDGGHALKTKSRSFVMVEIKNGPYLGKDYDAVHI
jgi:cupin fold WbuC family metalloprotein